MTSIRINFRSILFIVLVLACLLVIVLSRNELSDLVATLASARLGWVLAGFALLALAMVNLSYKYLAIYRLYGITSTFKAMLPLILITRFVIVVAPSGGLSGWLPYLDDAIQRGYAIGRVTFAVFTQQILWLGAVSSSLFAGIISLQWLGLLDRNLLAAAGGLLLLDIILLVGLVLAGIAPRVLYYIVQSFLKLVRWILTPLRIHPAWLMSPANAARFVLNIRYCVQRLTTSGFTGIAEPLGRAVLDDLLFMGIFYCITLAFGLELSLPAVIALYSTNSLFYIISPTPGGIGFVEGSVAWLLTSLGLEEVLAISLVVVYRGVTFWALFLVGFVALVWVNLRVGVKAIRLA